MEGVGVGVGSRETRMLPMLHFGMRVVCSRCPVCHDIASG